MRLSFDGLNDTGSVDDGKLSILPASIDFGVVKQGQVAPIDLTLTNRSSGKISEIRVQTSCGCTVIQSAKGALLAGEATHVRGEVDTHGRRGEFVTHLLLQYVADGQLVQRTLPLKASVEPAILINPAPLHFVARRESNTSPQCAVLTLSAHNSASFAITSINCWDPAISVRELHVPESAEHDQKQGLSESSHRLEVVFDQLRWQSTAFSRDKPALIYVSTDVKSESRLEIPIIVDID